AIQGEYAATNFADYVRSKGDDGLLAVDAIADAYWALHSVPKRLDPRTRSEAIQRAILTKLPIHTDGRGPLWISLHVCTDTGREALRLIAPVARRTRSCLTLAFPT